MAHEFKRILSFKNILREMSVLFLGPRQTGKSTFVENTFPQALRLDLLDSSLFRDLQKNPNALKELVAGANSNLIFVDEVQKIPELLDVVQSLMREKPNLRFILSGSSARKLRKQGTNLLGGRAFPAYFHPICSKEFLHHRKDSSTPSLDTLLTRGGLPSILNAKDPSQQLNAYVGVYIQEEIRAEALTRNLGDFNRFLDIAALTNGEQIDFSGIARDVQLSPRTVASYYGILQDTLIGYLLEPYRKTKTRKAVATPKFYFFDLGVVHRLIGREKLPKGTPELGKALEHFIFTELLAYKDYVDNTLALFYWRSLTQFEVDFVVQIKNEIWGIEVKSTDHVDKDDFKGLRALAEEIPHLKKIVVCMAIRPSKTSDEITVLPLQTFCEKLWSKSLI